MNSLRMTSGLIAGALMLTACAGSGDVSGGVSFDDVRGRAQAASVGVSAVYMTITNDSDADMELVGAEVPAEIAGYAEIHETVAVEGDMSESSSESMDDMATDMASESMDDMASESMDDMDELDEMDGMGGMEMRQVQSLMIPAGETVTLEPGGLHVMLFELVDDLDDGQMFDVTLLFADGTSEVLEVVVTTTP